jgi:pyruvate/2-oxoglutarate dehydrogenase complex dihydrolipoamide dehydrogenase (E3) component
MEQISRNKDPMNEDTPMPQPDQFEILVLGSGKSGKLLAWHMAQSGRRTAVVERRWIGGSCPNVACLPTKNEIWSARVAHLARQGARFGVVTAQVTTDMPTVRRRKRDMVNREIDFHLQRYKATGTELIMGSGRFMAPKSQMRCSRFSATKTSKFW